MEVTQYVIRPVTRYVVTKHQVLGGSEGFAGSALSRPMGEFDSAEAAEMVAQALVDADKANGVTSQRYMPE